MRIVPIERSVAGHLAVPTSVVITEKFISSKLDIKEVCINWEETGTAIPWCICVTVYKCELHIYGLI